MNITTLPFLFHKYLPLIFPMVFPLVLGKQVSLCLFLANPSHLAVALIPPQTQQTPVPVCLTNFPCPYISAYEQLRFSIFMCSISNPKGRRYPEHMVYMQTSHLFPCHSSTHCSQATSLTLLVKCSCEAFNDPPTCQS